MSESAYAAYLRRLNQIACAIREEGAMYALESPPLGPGEVMLSLTLETRAGCPHCSGTGIASRIQRDGETARVIAFECDCATWRRVDRLPPDPPGATP